MPDLGLPVFVLLAIAGACAVVWLVAEVRGRVPRVPVVVGPSWMIRHRRAVVRSAVATVLALVVIAVTGWAAAGIGAGCMAAFGPVLFGGARAEKARISDIEALAEWTEALRDASSRSALPAAIMATATTAPARLQAPLQVLTEAMAAREPLPVALRRTAQALPDPVAHEVIGGLIAATYARGGHLQATLADLAATAREMVRVRQQIEATRRPTRMAMLTSICSSVLLFTVLAVFSPQFMAPLSTPTGQLVLAVAVTLEGIGVWLMWRLAQVREPELFIAREPVHAAGVAS